MNPAREFTARLAELLRRERTALGEFLVELAAFDRQRLWLELGHASLFAFLHRELGLSKGAAYYRKTAAELVQKYPEVIEPLRDGRLCFTSVVELAKVLTPENRGEVLPRFFHVSKREAKDVSAEIRPVEAPSRRDMVTVARAPAPAPALALSLRGATPDLRQVVVHPDEPRHSASAAPGPSVTSHEASGPAPELAPPQPRMSATSVPPPPVHSEPDRAAAPRSTVEPLTGDSSRLHVTVSRGFLKKLEAARDALSHSHPGAGMEEILEAGLDLLLERHAKRKGLVNKPRAEPRPSKPGHVPAHVLRAVWKRDGGRCQWRLESGGICGSTHRVEIDHRLAKARGGPPTVENLRCLCRVHNDLAARELLGNEWMDRYTRRGGGGGVRRAGGRGGRLPGSLDLPSAAPP